MNTGRAWLALLASTAALLGTSAPQPVFVTLPPTEVAIPAGSVGRFRVVVTPDDDGGGPSRFLVAATGSVEGDTVVRVASTRADGPRVELVVVPRSVAAEDLARPGPPGASRHSASVPLAPCEGDAPCTVEFTVDTQPPADVVLVLQHPPRAADRSGIFPFDGPDVEGTKEREAERLQFFIAPPRPAAVLAEEPPGP